jgi:hypothetical protein
VKKAIILIAVLTFVSVFACAQTVSTDPVTIGWDGEASSHEIAVQSGTDDIIILDETTVLEYYIDLQSLGHYGSFIILVRGVEEVDGYYDYSDWIRSDVEEDVIMIDGVAQTITLISIKPAAMPTMLRIK